MIKHFHKVTLHETSGWLRYIVNTKGLLLVAMSQVMFKFSRMYIAKQFSISELIRCR